uniref:Uncharacterized protein n=1 Tax=Kwoniella bestiolae CBS 10118 TaxID=1296100 RepID=A0A1B9G3P4_9TREE|nr:hypothetical protein I302_05453 [Kwoniella bestiolae CBS 10118]OCF25631.1 hypothetical protein I302_05453 [Kwoniella bestiolae CBS 10118]
MIDHALADSTVKASPPIYPHSWREIINGTLEEQFGDEHIQLLLYLALNHSTHNIPPELPIQTLSKILSLHQPISFAQAIPFHPSATGSKEQDPIWLQWDYKRSDLHRSIWKCMRGCEEEGVWALIWEKEKDGSGGDKKRKRYSNLDEEEGRRDRKIGKEGWELLGWLVSFWEKDRSERTEEIDTHVYSPLFVRQLPKPFDRTGQLPRNDASFPLTTLKAAYLTSKAGEEGERRKSIAVRLLLLVLDTASGTKPPFHPSSLSSSLIHTLRFFAITDIQDIMRKLGRSRHWRIACHILTLLFEDSGGMRNTKLAQRRADKNLIKREFGSSSLDRPTARYLFEELIPLLGVTRDVHVDNEARMIMLLLELLSIMKVQAYDAEDLQDIRKKYKGNREWWDKMDCSMDAEKLKTPYVMLLKRCIKNIL